MSAPRSSPSRAASLLLLIAVGCAAPAVEIPSIDLSEMEPQVRAVLEQARAGVIERPDSADAWGELATLADAHGLLDVAERAYRQAHARAPGEFRWIYLLAVVRDLQGAEPEELAGLFEQARVLRPDYAPIPARLGDVFARGGLHDRAREQLERALVLDPDSAVAHRRLGQVLLASGDAERAAEHLERARVASPEDRVAHSSLAQAYLRLGRAEEAQELVRRAEHLEPVNMLVDPVHERWVFSRSVSSTRVFRRALARLRGGDPAGAIPDLERLLAARTEHAGSVHFWLGTAYAADGRSEPAIEQFTEAIRVQPRLNQARLELARLELERGAPAAAAEHLRRFLELRADDPQAHRLLAGAYLALGDDARARQHRDAADRIEADGERR